MIIRDLHTAAFLKARGFQLGKVNYPDIEIKGEDKEIESEIEHFENGGAVNAKLLFKEMNFIKYLSNRNGK